MNRNLIKKLAAVMLCLAMLLAVVAQTSCNDTPAETTPAETTEEKSPETTPEATEPESTPEPETTPESGDEYNISYDLDGGIVEGNPLVYNNAKDTKIAIPVKVGYDFVGWTGTGIDTPTVSVTIEKGTEGDISLKANWVENGEFEFNLTADTEDVFGKLFFDKAKGVFVINGEQTFESNPAINASNELVAQKLQSYFEKNKQIIKMLRDENLAYSGVKYDFMMYIGVSDCEPVEEFVSTLNYAQYGVAVNEGSLCYIAWTEAANAEAGAILYEIIEHVVANGGSISDFAGGRYVGSVEGTVGADLPALPGLDGGTDVGEGAYQLYSIDSTKEIYDAYLKSLEDAGYTFHTSNVMNKTYCATYYNDNEVVNVVFAGGDASGVSGTNADRSLRVVVDPMSITALPATEKPADANADVTVSSVTQMWPQNLCIVFQLSNGHFIIWDSGNNGTQKVLSDFLREKAPDGKPVVEAWIFSHFHQDHIGGFVDYMGVSSLTRYITVKSVIYNFPSERTYMTASGSSTDMNNMKQWYNNRIPALREGGTTVYQARTGQKYYFGNAEVEILWTFEDLTPFNIFTDSTNRTDIGIRVTLEGQTFMLTGDSTEEEFRVAAARYGNWLKSDFLQLAHHGSGNGCGVHELYTLTAAPVIFHPRMQTLEDTHYGIGGNEKNILRKDTTKLVIRSGNYGIATLKLPFTVGDPIESTKTPVDESHTYME